MPMTDVTVKELGERIAFHLRKARERRGISQEVLAKKCRMTRKTIANYEGGKRTKFEGLVLLMRAAGALGLEVGDLLGPRP
jgi:transcriptional regulator with XRE-family HTH domain